MMLLPGLDFCARSPMQARIGVAKEINEALDDMDYIHDIGEFKESTMSGWHEWLRTP